MKPRKETSCRTGPHHPPEPAAASGSRWPCSRCRACSSRWTSRSCSWRCRSLTADLDPSAHRAAVDHRRLRLPDRRRADRDGHARRPDRPPARAARRRRPRSAPRPCSRALSTSPEMLIAARGRAGARRRDARCRRRWRSCSRMFTDEKQRTAALGADHGLASRPAPRWGRCSAARCSSSSPGARSFVRQRPGDGAAARPRPAAAARVPQPGRRPHRPASAALSRRRPSSPSVYGVKEVAHGGRRAAARRPSPPASAVGARLRRAARRRLAEPLIDVGLFRTRAFSAALGGERPRARS